MYIVPLQSIPNQQFMLRLDNANFDITIKEARGIMLFSLMRDGRRIVDCVRCASLTPLIPYAWLEGEAGNFCFTTQDNAYAHYSRFGGTDILYYVTGAELAAGRRKGEGL